MFIAWWTGKGYLVMLYGLIATLCYGLLINVSGGAVPDNGIGWACAFLVAAGLTWQFGSKHNAKSRRSALQRQRFKHRLYYPARHKFFSLPMETSAVLWAAAAIFALVNSFR